MVSPGAVVCVATTTPAFTSGPSGEMREAGLVAQQTGNVFGDEALLPSPERRLARTRAADAFYRSAAVGCQACFCGMFRTVTIVITAWRSALLTSIVIRSRVRQTRMREYPGES